MNLQHRQRLLVWVAAAVLAVLLGDRLILTPAIKHWKARSARIADLRKKVSQGALLLDRARTIRERWASMQDNVLTNNLSAAENDLIKAFDRWSRDSGISVSAIRPQAKRGEDDAYTLECRADAFGSLSSIARFLYLLEKDPIALRIDSVELNRRDPQAQQLTLGLQVNALLLPTPRS